MAGRYPPHLSTTLVIDSSWSYCGACGRGAYCHQLTHHDVAGWNPEPGGGCGVRWTHVTTTYAGDDIKGAVMCMRPDLPWIDPFEPAGDSACEPSTPSPSTSP